jgi:hypothetical protein
LSAVVQQKQIKSFSKMILNFVKLIVCEMLVVTFSIAANKTSKASKALSFGASANKTSKASLFATNQKSNYEGAISVRLIFILILCFISVLFAIVGILSHNCQITSNQSLIHLFKPHKIIISVTEM